MIPAEWETRACRDQPWRWDDTLDKHGYAGELAADRRRRHAWAVRQCLKCPVLAACRKLDTTGMAGIVAGRWVG